VCIAFIVTTGYRTFFIANVLVKQKNKQIFIHKDMSYANLKQMLIENNCLHNALSFDIAAYLLNYKKKIIRGSYLLKSGMNNWNVIVMLKKGIQHPVRLTLNNIKDINTLSYKITSYLEMDQKKIENLLCDCEFLNKYNFNTDNILAMFIPDTYEVYWTITPQELFERMFCEYKKFWNSNRLQKANEIKLTAQQVYILASIVQKETNKLDEAPTIAGVYINRLRKNMALAADPTIIYILGDNSINRVLKKHTIIESKYNTYKYKGLPPGPICMPSIAMIDSVLNYETHNFYFFSAKEDFCGYHCFSKSFEEHKTNGRRYRRKLREKTGIKTKIPTNEARH